MCSLFSEISVEFKHPNVYAILDVLMGSSRDKDHRLTTSRMLEPESSFVSIMEDAVLDSASVIDLDSHPVVIPEGVIVDVLEKDVVVVDSLPKFCTPRKGVSAIRSFPPGCGRGASRVRIQDCPKDLKSDGLRNKGKQCHGASSSKKADKLSAAADLGKSRLQSPAIPGKESKYLKVLEGTMKNMTGNKDRSGEVKISRDSDYVKSGPERPIDGQEPMVKTIVVQALKAAQNCPWRPGKRMRKS